MKIKCTHCGRNVRLGKKKCPHCKSPITYRKPVKNRVSWFFKFFLVFAVCVGVVIFAWFAVGNQIVLFFESSSVVIDINSGDLAFTKEQDKAYDSLPNYVKNMLPEREEEKDGPILEAMLPYIGAEVESINGYFGNASVTYKIYAPDLGTWLTELDYNELSSENELLSMLIAHIPTAPMRVESVAVDYYRDGIFALSGSYKTPEFANALYGGFNDAYTEFYVRVMEEIKEAVAE